MPIVALQPHGSKPPFWCVHGVGGEIDSFRELAAALMPSKQPFYAFQANPVPFETISETAAHYLDLLRKKQPRGPYHLGGYSLGGLIAFEMAQQLAHKVANLIIIDTVPPPLCYWQMHWNIRTTVEVVSNIGRWGATTFLPEAMAMGWRNALGRSKRQLVRTVKARMKQCSPDYVFSPNLAPQMLSMIDGNFKAKRSYQPGYYPGSATLIRCLTLPLFRYYPHDFGWSKHVDKLSVRLMKGNHSSILKGKLANDLANQIVLSLETRKKYFSFT